MSYRCEVCGKEPWFGKQVSFSHKRSSRRWLPNIQRLRPGSLEGSVFRMLRQGQRLIFDATDDNGTQVASNLRFGSDGN
jgi:ribosomal protein L28